MASRLCLLLDVNEEFIDLKLKFHSKDKIFRTAILLQLFSNELGRWENNLRKRDVNHIPNLKEQIEKSAVPYEGNTFLNIHFPLQEEYKKRLIYFEDDSLQVYITSIFNYKC